MEWFEKIIRWLMMVWSGLKKIWSEKEEMQSRTKGSKFHSFDTFSYFGYTLSYNDRIEVILSTYLHLNLREISTFGMKTLKSSSVVFIVKKSKCWSANSVVVSWNRALTSLWYFSHISVHKTPNWMILKALEI